MQMRYVTVVIFMRTIQMILLTIEYFYKQYVIWIKNRLQMGKNIIFGLLRTILNQLVW